MWVPRSLVYGPGVHKPYMIKFSKGHQRAKQLALTVSSESNIWYRALICGPGALQLYLSKCSKRNHRRNILGSKGPSKSNAWAHRVWIRGHGALSSVQINVVRETVFELD